MNKLGDAVAFAFIGGAIIFGLIAIATTILAVPVALGLGVYGIYRYHIYQENTPEALERKARERTLALYEDAKLRAMPNDKMEFGKGLANNIQTNVPDRVFEIAVAAGLELYDMERWSTHVPPPPAICNSIEGARYRDLISKASAFGSYDVSRIQRTFGESIRPALEYVAGMHDDDYTDIHQPLHTFIPPDKVAETVLQIVRPYYDDSIAYHFKNLRDRLDRNAAAAKDVLPHEYKGNDVIKTYLGGTPFIDIMNIPVPIPVPRTSRWEHAVVTGGAGHGKTTLLENLILKDLKDQEQPSIVVVDSQRALIGKLSKLAEAHYRPLIIIDPKDAPALNPFAFNQKRYLAYNDDGRERVRNHTMELFSYLFDSLLGADLTTRQGALFNYLIQVMLAMPETMGRNATLEDLITFTEKPEDYAKAIDALQPLAKTFFATDFLRQRYNETKEQLRYRLHAILGNASIARLFLAKENNVDFFEELNKGAIILIDTDKGFLGAKNSAYLGRIAITLILQAILERDASGTPQREVFMYVDEAGEYFDKSIDKFLTEARKQRAGITLAHQHFGQMTTELRASVAANTATKYAGGLSAQDARSAAQDMRTSPDFLLAQDRLHFACYIRSVTKAPTTVEAKLGMLEKEEQVSEAAYQKFRETNRKRLAAAPENPKDGSPPPEPRKKKSKLSTDPSEYT